MPGKSTLYLETSIPSYLAALPSRDLIVAAHQQVTHEWWRKQRTNYDLYISEAVLEEIRGGDAKAVERRLAFVEDLPILAINEKAAKLSKEYQTRLGLPRSAKLDDLHLAIAVAYELDYLLTWNCAHLANGIVIRRLQAANAIIGLSTPIIVTPEELMEYHSGG
jgi:predicted nucleic acid-binding protein